MTMLKWVFIDVARQELLDAVRASGKDRAEASGQLRAMCECYDKHKDVPGMTGHRMFLAIPTFSCSAGTCYLVFVARSDLYVVLHVAWTPNRTQREGWVPPVPGSAWTIALDRQQHPERYQRLRGARL